MLYLISWALVAVGLCIVFAGIRQNKLYLLVIGPAFLVAGLIELSRAFHH